ncbi:MAG TPA: ATP-dependent RNA helicase DbpA, partial [Thauera sp.]|nr:ATP-dependent RNA helicase DbpA [Thauera sp.]
MSDHASGHPAGAPDQVVAQSSATEPGQPFDSLPLSAAMLDTLRQLDYRTMTPIQAASLPLALAGDDLIAQAKT